MTDLKNHTIQCKVAIFPSETEMLSVYERLIGFSERECSKAFKIALIAIHEFKIVPGWFYSMERNRFPTARGRSFRLKLAPMDASTRGIFNLLEPMPETERIVALKSMFRNAAISKTKYSQPPEISTSLVQQTATQPNNIDSPKPTQPTEFTKPSEESDRKKNDKINSLAGLYR